MQENKIKTYGSRIIGKCRFDLKPCSFWKTCNYNKNDACSAYIKHTIGAGSGDSCSKCKLKMSTKGCQFKCFRRDKEQVTE